MPFKNTKWDYIILTAAIIVFLHGFLTIEYVPTYSMNNEYINGYEIKLSVQVILAPLIAGHRFYLIYLGDKGNIKTLRERNIKLVSRVWLLNKIEYHKSEFGKLSNTQKNISFLLWFIVAILGFIIFVFLLT